MPENDIVSDARRAGANRPGGEQDVSSVVARYVPAGADRRAVERYLRTCGFAVSEGTDGEGRRLLLASHAERRAFQPSVREALSLRIELSGDAVGRASGTLARHPA